MKIEKDDGLFIYKCDYCGKEFSKSTSLAAHLTHCKEFYLKRDGNLDNCNKATQKFVEKYKGKATKSYGTYICECGKIFNTKQAYAGHCCGCEVHLGHKPNKRIRNDSKDGGWKCTECHKIFRTRQELQNHRKEFHSYPNKNKHAGKHILDEKVFCKYCNQSFSTLSGLKNHEKCCKNNPNRINGKSHKHSEETRKKLSKKLKKYYEGSCQWATVREKRKSYPEQYFDNIFIDAEQNYHANRFFLDLAWPDKKIYIEIDGEQHYKDNKLIDRDIERDKLLKQEGWTLICRIRWSKYIKLSDENKTAFLEGLKNKVNNF